MLLLAKKNGLIMNYYKIEIDDYHVQYDGYYNCFILSIVIFLS